MTREDKYNYNPMFRNLVQMLIDVMDETALKPEDIREATGMAIRIKEEKRVLSQNLSSYGTK